MIRKAIRRWLVMGSMILFVLSCTTQKAIDSPNGEISVIVDLSEAGVCSFSAYLNGETIVKNSPLGIRFEEEGFDFTSGLKPIEVNERVIDEDYTMLVGKQLERRNHCTESIHSFENQSGQVIDIVFRLFDDAVAFSYRIQNKVRTKMVDELSGFNFATIENTWSIPYSSGDEQLFTKQALGEALEKNTLSFPILIETESRAWALISESDVSTYPLSSGQFAGSQINYVFSNAGIARNSVRPGFQSPWRVMILGDRLGTIVESCVIDHLAPPTKMYDLSWIEPGVTSFPWWGNNLSNSYPDTLKKYIDLSAEMGWRFMEFDIPLIGSPGAAIEKWKTVDWIKDVVDYGLEKGVLCYGWDDLKNLSTQDNVEDIFSRYNEFGVRGIKVDFVNSYTQRARRLIELLIQHAANYQLMVSFHGAQSPRGFARTYPHVITFEAVKGSEYYLSINGGKGVTPEHNCILPFSRNVLGSMDYTPVAFSSDIRTTTMAHELALSIIFESGWQGICDVPEAYLNSVAKDFLSQLHSTWDATIFLDGYPGEYCCIARRKGDKWYIAGINSGAPRTVKLKLPVTSAEKVKVYADRSDDLNSLGVFEFDLSENLFEITMRKNGGFAFIIKN